MRTSFTKCIFCFGIGVCLFWACHSSYAKWRRPSIPAPRVPVPNPRREAERLEEERRRRADELNLKRRLEDAKKEEERIRKEAEAKAREAEEAKRKAQAEAQQKVKKELEEQQAKATEIAKTLEKERNAILDQQKRVEEKLKQEQQKLQDQAITASKEIERELKNEIKVIERDLNKIRAFVVQHFVGDTKVGVKLHVPCEAGLNLYTAAFALSLDLGGGIRGVADEDTLRDLQRGNWTWPQFNLRDALTAAFSQQCVGRDLLEEQRASFLKEYALGIPVFASRSFVEWASVEMVAKHIVTLIATEGGSAKQTIAEVKQRLFYELDRLCTAFVLRGMATGDISSLIADTFTSSVKTVTEMSKSSEVRDTISPKVQLPEPRVFAIANDKFVLRLETRNIPYWSEYSLGTRGAISPKSAATVKTPGLSLESILADVSAKGLEGISRQKWSKGKVNTPEHLGYAIVLISKEAEKEYDRLRQLEREISSVMDEASRLRLDAEIEQEKKRLADKLAKQVEDLIHRIRKEAFSGHEKVNEVITGLVNRVLEKAGLSEDEKKWVRALVLPENEKWGMKNPAALRLNKALDNVVDDILNAWRKSPTSNVVDLMNSDKKYVVSQVEAVLAESFSGVPCRATVTGLTFDIYTWELNARADLELEFTWDVSKTLD